LNAEEEPETYYYPKDPEFRKKFGPRGVLDCKNVNGKQSCVDTGPLTQKRMETIDDELYTHAAGFIDQAAKSNQPFFVWFNTTRMHVWTRLKPSSEGKTGIGLYPDGMVEHDALVGELLKKIDDLGLRDNTIVIYSTDNGAEVGTWPDVIWTFDFTGCSDEIRNIFKNWSEADQDTLKLYDDGWCVIDETRPY